jgi:aspartyl-tRNA(Asn)/glutamyl-tRNA(Gln) amidotransferase subunit A
VGQVYETALRALSSAGALLEARGRISRALRGTQRFDALLMPTCPVVAPPIASVADDAHWMELNRRLVRVNILANFLDRCALRVCPAAPPARDRWA